jgi:Zn-dependent M16 (insulinase) family peptidase
MRNIPFSLQSLISKAFSAIGMSFNRTPLNASRRKTYSFLSMLHAFSSPLFGPIITAGLAYGITKYISNVMMP